MVYGMVGGANKFAVNPCQNGVRGGLRFRQSKAREIRLMGFFLFVPSVGDTLRVAPRVNYASAQLTEVHNEDSPQCVGGWCKQRHR
jgi:hypothetical protein